MPLEGVATYPFTVEAAGTYRIWARVIAPSTADDSFWIRIDAGVPLRWNAMAPGASWHWALVHGDGGPAAAAFPLAAGEHVLSVGYREDGARLDALVVTSDDTFDPTAPTAAAPATPHVATTSNASGVMVTWSAVPGAQSYTLIRDDQVLATGLVGHVYSAPGAAASGCYDVLAVGPGGVSAPSPWCTIAPTDAVVERRYVDSNLSSASLPMQVTEDGLTASPGTANSPDAPPVRGRGRFDFRTGARTKWKVWAATHTAGPAQDSFWVRVDNGRWIKWNNIPGPSTCDDVHDSDNGGRAVVYDLPAGSHRLEFAHRESGASLWKVALTDDLTYDRPCHD